MECNLDGGGTERKEIDEDTVRGNGPVQTTRQCFRVAHAGDNPIHQKMSCYEMEGTE